MYIDKVVSYNIVDIEPSVAEALARLLSNIDRDSINKYLESRGGMPNIIGHDEVKKLVEIGQDIHYTIMNMR